RTCPHPPTSPPFPYTTLSRSGPMAQQQPGKFLKLAHGRIRHQVYARPLGRARHTYPRLDRQARAQGFYIQDGVGDVALEGNGASDRKSTRLNSSHVKISYAVF